MKMRKWIVAATLPLIVSSASVHAQAAPIFIPIPVVVQPPPPQDPVKEIMDNLHETAAAQARKGWGAIAVAPGLAQVGSSIDRRTNLGAKSAALRDCARKGGQDCAVVANAQNECIALALNADKLYAVGFGKDEFDASGHALADCNAGSPDKVCNLYGPPICPGLSGGVLSRGMSDEEKANVLEVSTDARDFWGAVVGDDKAVYASANALTQSAAEQVAKTKCGDANCRLIGTYQNSCVAVAWTSHPATHPFVSQRSAPEEARIDALTQCSAAGGGSCRVSVPNCTGRAYAEYDFSRVHTGVPLEDGGRSRQQGSRLLESWVGHDVDEFQRDWGVSLDTLRIMEGEETLRYVKDYTTVAGVKRSCTISVFTRANRVFSYLTQGDACGEILR